MAVYAKAIVAVLIAGLTVVHSAITDGIITNEEWVAVGLALLGAVAVYLVPNKQPDQP